MAGHHYPTGMMRVAQRRYVASVSPRARRPLPFAADAAAVTELEDWLPRSPTAAPWTPDEIALVDAMLSGPSDGNWLGEGLQYEVPAADTATAAAVPSQEQPAAVCGGGACGSGALLADVEALLASGGCCKGEAGAANCCRITTRATTAASVEPKATASSPAPSDGCGCSDGSCGSGGGSSDSSSVRQAATVMSSMVGNPESSASVSAKPKRTRVRRSHLTPDERAAIRREQHRDTMRRSRQRFRDKIDAMIQTVADLEAFKQRALAANGPVVSTKSAADRAVLRDQVVFLEQQARQLEREQDELHAQVVRSLLDITQQFPSAFRSTAMDYSAADSREHLALAPSASDAHDDVGLTLCDFITWDAATVGHCLQLVRDSYGEITRFYAALAAAPHDGDYFASRAFQSSGLDLMGWRDHRRIVGDSCVEFAFDKLFPAADADDLFLKTWLFCRDQQTFGKMFAPVVAALQLEVLHEIHDDLVVVRRMQQERDGDGGVTKFRSIDLLYRVEAPEGSFVVFRSVNPDFARSCGCAGNAWFDSFMWFGFSRDAFGCRARFGGTLDGHSPAYARRWMLEIFFVLLRWESLNVAPFLLVQ